MYMSQRSMKFQSSPPLIIVNKIIKKKNKYSDYLDK